MDSPQLHIYTGDGKGKTTCAIGLAIRALGAGLRVDWIAFDKGSADQEYYAERNLMRSLPGMNFIPTGLERFRPGERFRFGVTPQDRAEAERGLSLAREHLLNGQADLLILDEILSACTYRLIHEEDVMSIIQVFLDNRPRELVLTGRSATASMIEAADLVTELAPRKHYFSKGLAARKGIDY